ncbi:UNVERIFIED_CONTAM: hypothetical protein K2H54_026461 [Gekko kuhli]
MTFNRFVMVALICERETRDWAGQDFFESYISVASTVPSVLCLIGNFLLVNKRTGEAAQESCLPPTG